MPELPHSTESRVKLAYKGDSIPLYKVKALEMVAELGAPSMVSLHPYSGRIINFMVNVFYPSFGSVSKTKASNNVAVFQINSVTLHSPIIKSTCLVYLVVRGESIHHT